MNINVGQDGEVDVPNDLATNTAIWYTKPHQIDLKEMVMSHKLHQKQIPLEMTYTMHFTAINGIQPNVSENIEETQKMIAEGPHST